MLDIVLLITAGCCQLALAYLGFRVSAKAPKKRDDRHKLEILFVIVGLIGLGAIVWSGVRSTGAQNAIADGISHIEAKLGITRTADRRLIKANLGLFYAQGEKLANDGPPSREPEEYKKYQAAIADWRLSVVKWLNDNMASSASAKFLDWQPQFRLMGFEGAGAQEIWDRDYTFALCRNLDLMIQSDAWDKAQ